MSKVRIAAATLAIAGIGLEASAHAWSAQDAVWVGFACVVAGCLILWFGEHN